MSVIKHLRVGCVMEKFQAIASDNRKEGWAIRKEDVFAFTDKKETRIEGNSRGIPWLIGRYGKSEAASKSINGK
ncbi:hypothetical protein ACT7DG_00320 [Bacillus cereus]